MSNIDSLFHKMGSPTDSRDVRVPIGVDGNGEILFRSLKNIHHLLIGGTIGSGKTSYILTVLTSIIARHSPKEIRFIIIDTKLFNYSVFVGVPHLLCPVITDTTRMGNALKWVTFEIKDRLQKMATVGARDIDGYNSYCRINAENPFPSLVIVIDDLSLCRIDNSLLENLKDILRNGRTAGVHMVLSTSSFSTRKLRDDVIPMFPCRAAFKVISSADSRVLLDKNGAENLEAPYEMIYKDMICTSKCKACFVPFEEVKQVLNSSKSKYSLLGDNAERIGDNTEQRTNKNQTTVEDRDEARMCDSAAKIVIESGYASVSLLQRRLNLGYPVASRLLDSLEKQGLIGPFNGSKPRKVLLTLDEWNNRSDSSFLDKKEKPEDPKETDDSENKPDTIMRPFAKQRIGDCEVSVENNHLSFIKNFSPKDSLKYFNVNSPVPLNGSFSGDILIGIKARYAIDGGSTIRFVFKDDVNINKTSDHLDNIDRPCLSDLLEIHFSTEYIKVAKAFVKQVSEDCGIVPEETDLINISHQKTSELNNDLPKPSDLPSTHDHIGNDRKSEIQLREFINTKIGDCTIEISDNIVHFYKDVRIAKQRNGTIVADPGTLPGSFSGKQLKRIEVLYSKYLPGYIRFFFVEMIKNARSSTLILDIKKPNEADVLEIRFYIYQKEIVESLVQQLVEDTGVPFSEQHDDKKPEAPKREQISLFDLQGEKANQKGDVPSSVEQSKSDSSKPDSPPPIAPSSSGGGFPPSPHNPFRPWWY